jgi:tripartite-type tricarboxylate transporter receptor subunit TctC
MKKKLKIIIALGTTLLLSSSLIACSSNSSNGDASKEVEFPTKAIELIVPYSAGGGTDSVTRALADAAKDNFSKPLVVVNKTGGGGAVGLTAGATAKPDGYTVTVATVELTTLPHLGLATFTQEDFKPIMQLNAEPSAITVKADAPWNTLEEFIKYSKENPGKVKVGNSGVGAIWHLATEALAKEADVEFNSIPYDGAAPAVAALLGGHIDAVSVSPPEVYSQVKAGQLKVLGVMSEKRADSVPEVKTMKEQGYDVVISTWRGLAVPKDTPDTIVAILSDGFKKASEEQSFKDFMNKNNITIEILDSKQYKDKIIKDDNYFKTLITELGLNK